MTTKKDLSFRQVKSCLKSRAWNNFPLSKLKEKVDDAKRCLSSQHEASTVYREETISHILTFFKPFCTDVRRKKLTVRDMAEALKEEVHSPTVRQDRESHLHTEAKIRVWREINVCFGGDKTMYEKMLFG